MARSAGSGRGLLIREVGRRAKKRLVKTGFGLLTEKQIYRTTKRQVAALEFRFRETRLPFSILGQVLKGFKNGFEMEVKKLAPHHVGRKRHYLLKVRAVQREYQTHKINEGILDRWIFENHIGPKFCIGRGTLRAMLEINVRQEWRRAGLDERILEAA